MARRAVHLLATDKTGAELKERIVARTRQPLAEVPGIAEMFVGTIHAFCLELMKPESPKDLKLEVLNEVQQALLVDRSSSKRGVTTSAGLTGRALKRCVDTPHHGEAPCILREAVR